MKDKTFKKVMRPNSSEFPNMHAHPLEKLEEIEHPLIPKLFYYDDTEYECEFIEGTDFETHIRKTGDYGFGLEVLNLVQDLSFKMSQIEFGLEFPYSHKLNWRMGAEDIHCKNILISAEGKPYLIDLDQIGWWHPFTIFKLINQSTYNMTDSLRYSLLLWSNDLSIQKANQVNKKAAEDATKQIKEIADTEREKAEAQIKEMSTKLKSNYEDGVRHGFWNVKTSEEIREHYEKYKQ